AQNVIDWTRGDVTYLYQLSAASSDAGTPYLGIVRGGADDMFRSYRGLVMELAAPERQGELAFDWALSAFAGERDLAAPDGTSAVHEVAVVARPGPVAYGEFSSSGDLALARL